MNVTFDQPKMVRDIMKEARGLRGAVETAMAYRFWQLTISNFGIAGVDRPGRYGPHGFAKLSPAYARKVKREIATLVVSGRLKGAVHQEGNKVSVSDSEVAYATAHQYGSKEKHLPARPYFPIKPNGDCMPYTLSQVVEAGQQEIEKLL